MGSRTIAVSDDVYTRLRALKGPGESFSDLLNRLAGQPSLLDLVGILPRERANIVEKSIAEGRNRSRARRERALRR